MTYVLPLPSQSPLKRSFSDIPYLRPDSPIADNASTGTVRRQLPRNSSMGSLFTSRSHSFHDLTENTPPRSPSHSLLSLAEGLSVNTASRRSSSHHSRKASCDAAISLLSRCDSAELIAQQRDYPVLRLVTSNSPLKSQRDGLLDNNNTNEETDGGNLTDEAHSKCSPGNHNGENVQQEPECIHEKPKHDGAMPFKRWISTLRRKNLQRRQGLKPRAERWILDDFDRATSPTPVPSEGALLSKHKASHSTSSSMAFVTAVKSASITLASASLAPVSWRAEKRFNVRSDGRASGLSDPRMSLDSNTASFAHFVDESAWKRSVYRRKTLEELIQTEEGYVADMKVLANVYFTILASASTISTQMRPSIHDTVSHIIQIHESLLGELHRAVPNSDYSPSEPNRAHSVSKPKHSRWHSADIVPGRIGRSFLEGKLRHSLDGGKRPVQSLKLLTADPKTVADVARLFNKYMKRFFIYEEFAAQYEIVGKDMSSAQKNVTKWPTFERGIEALSDSVTSINYRDLAHKRALTFADLLIKPVQRVCRYPLLFADLCKHTPVYDDPESFGEVAKALNRLKEVAQEANSATHDPGKRRLIETTWLLQDRLAFEAEVPRAAVFRLLGRVLLCGVLHIAYNRTEGVRGQFMICVLYKPCLLLALTDRQQSSYVVVAAIALSNSSIEEPDNGRGLQCHTAPCSWKLVFESGHRLFEIIMSACSSTEEEAWRKHLKAQISSENQDLSEFGSAVQDLLPSMSLDPKPLGTVFGQPDTLTRRMSVHRTATLGPKINMNQVIIKNTQAHKDTMQAQQASGFPVTRSHSFLSANHIPVLAPRRSERIRLETALSDVWTKEILPYPGMLSRRTENPIRASANSVMRKLSMASIASNFTKRSASYSSLSHSRSEEPHVLAQKSSAPALRKPPLPGPKRRGAALVDFHNTPKAFLPADFELRDVRFNNPARRRRPISRTMSEDVASGHVRPVSMAGKRLSRPASFRGVGSRKTSALSVRTDVIEPEPDVKPVKLEEAASSTPTLPSTPSKQVTKSKIKLFRFWA